MIDIRVVDGWYIIRGPKMVLVLTKQEFIQCLRRGRWWQRQQGLQARLAAITERTQEGKHGSKPAAR
jgi:hypothetical protein